MIHNWSQVEGHSCQCDRQLIQTITCTLQVIDWRTGAVRLVRVNDWKDLLQHLMFMFPTAFAITLFMALSTLLVSAFLGYHVMHVMQVSHCSMILGFSVHIEYIDNSLHTPFTVESYYVGIQERHIVFTYTPILSIKKTCMRGFLQTSLIDRQVSNLWQRLVVLHLLLLSPCIFPVWWSIARHACILHGLMICNTSQFPCLAHNLPLHCFGWEASIWRTQPIIAA